MSKEANNVTRSRFEIEERAEVAYLEFETDSQGWMTIWHTEVPSAMRGRGVASELAQTAFEYAKQNDLRVDVICPLAASFLSKHPEYNSFVGKKADR
jgi:predicted GNAT family acetyltransferase